MGLVQYLYLVFRAITVHKFGAQQRQYKAWFLEFLLVPVVITQESTAKLRQLGVERPGLSGPGNFRTQWGVNQSQVKLGFMLDIHSWMGWKEHLGLSENRVYPQL